MFFHPTVRPFLADCAQPHAMLKVCCPAVRPVYMGTTGGMPVAVPCARATDVTPILFIHTVLSFVCEWFLRSLAMITTLARRRFHPI